MTEHQPEPNAAAAETEIEEKILSKEEQLENELQEYKDKYMRLLAETENTRKRLQKDKQDSIRFSTENVIAEFLTPMDNLENALRFAEQASPETVNWARGFHMILEQFKNVLSDNGVTTFVSVGTLFDPHCHEAVETEISDTQPEGTILQEYVKGYKSKDRIIRPAGVKVSKKSAPKEVASESENHQENKE